MKSADVIEINYSMSQEHQCASTNVPKHIALVVQLEILMIHLARCDVALK